jgi:hypothetical protein
MSATIIDKLNQLAEFQAQRDFLNLEKQEVINHLIPPEIRAQLEDVEAEFAAKLEGVNQNIETLEAEIRSDVLDCHESYSGSYLKAVWVQGRTSWDNNRLEDYAREHPEVLAFRKKGDPYIQIRKI